MQCSYRGMDPAVQGKDDLVDQKFTLEGTVTRKYTEGEKNYVELAIPGRARRRQHLHPRRRHRHPPQPRLAHPTGHRTQAERDRAATLRLAVSNGCAVPRMCGDNGPEAPAVAEAAH